MKKLGLITLITLCVALVTTSLFYWIKWQSKLQVRVISTEINQSTYKIGEAIHFQSSLNIPFQCSYELEAYELEDGLKEHHSGSYFTRKNLNSVILHESLFATKAGEYKNNQRTVHINSSKGLQTVQITYPTLNVQQREFAPERNVQSFGDITLSSPKSHISSSTALAIILSSSLILTLIILKKLPSKEPSITEKFITKMQQILDYKECATPAPLMTIQDETRFLLSKLYHENFLHANIEDSPWDELSENDSSLFRPYLERIFKARFHQQTIPKDEFQNMVKELIIWAQNLKIKDSK
ncbi:hypothetical protein LNTAR_03319 [Lentisphaera araneosa HTCC2155]|uniref:Uncharacterized protein n=1 Tax=Lentisphaera araneosa HTCC2155 TaxID=313628 RepID=A6DT51_9BACT|nr:hypothetical protein [Lentisphaera araneosa]EDM25226.1 hypothetical protein LNTAR_03319 [Lentisphaera araneosa HTCC2155]